jgi:hypothetical protein
LLLGKTENYGISDPWPIVVPGEAKPISSARVEEYVNAEFYYYYNFYTGCKHAGNPYPGGWIEWPPWTVQLITAFDTIIDRDRRDHEFRFLAQIHGYKVT